MDRPRFIRRVRLALSVSCVILCLVFTMLWVRSYWWVDNVIGPAKGSYRPGVASDSGWLTVRYGNGKLDPEAFPEWKRQSRSAVEMEEVYKQMEASIKGTNATFSRPTKKLGWKADWGFQFPWFLPTLITGLLAAAVGWKLPFQYGLRTLLVATTFIAVALGLLVAYLRLL